VEDLENADVKDLGPGTSMKNHCGSSPLSMAPVGTGLRRRLPVSAHPS